MIPTLADIEAAAAAIQGAIDPTPTVPARRLSERLGARLFLKLENLHHTGSFKERGALNRLLALDPAAARAGVVAMSAGNHAQGVAYHAARLGIPATIVMPSLTPFNKVARTEAYGARVVLHGDGVAAAEELAHRLAERDGLTFVHPYDDPRIIAGQGTVALELLAAPELPDTVLVPVGGGGLIAGMAVALKALKPKIRIVGVESALFPSMRQVVAGLPVAAGGMTVAEGIAVTLPGELTRQLVADLVDDIVLVDEGMIERAIFLLMTEQKIVAEGAGAVGLAAMLAEPARYAGQSVTAVISGGNLDARLAASILMRGLARDGQLVRLRIGLNDAPGSLARVTFLLGEAGGNIVEVYHQRLFHDVPVRQAEVDVVLETRDRSHVATIVERLRAAGFTAALMTDLS